MANMFSKQVYAMNDLFNNGFNNCMKAFYIYKL